jgi:sulfatase maturation enzyme AslB (radical SAM superfamily)
MIRHGDAPFLECSSKGDKRFSAFYARIKSRGNLSIEDLYQAFKIFENGETGLTWRAAKGRKAVNQEDANKFYRRLWKEYVKENPELLEVLICASGVSDIFGQEGHACQATELWRIRRKALEKDHEKHSRRTDAKKHGR